MILFTLLSLIFGIGLGLFSKILDTTDFNALPAIFQRLDITNFLGRFSFWIFTAVCIAVYSSSAKRAAWNVFAFFAGMVSAYYAYSALAAGFFPKSYAMIWFAITAISPLLAVGCRFAKNDGVIAVILTGVIIGVLFSQAVFLLQGIRIAHIPELIIWIASLFVLRRKPKEFAAALGISLVTALLIQRFLPYWG